MDSFRTLAIGYNIKWHEIKGLILVSFIFHYINENKLQFDVMWLVKLTLALNDVSARNFRAEVFREMLAGKLVSSDRVYGSTRDG